VARVWAEANQSVLGAAEPKAPPGIVDRRLSNWSPLLAVADAAGGKWPNAIRDAAVWLEAQQEPDDELRILNDCRRFGSHIPTQTFFLRSAYSKT
jgi:hypothetical protein